MCQYCENKNPVWAIEDGCLFERALGEDPDAPTLKINFCPFCGKRIITGTASGVVAAAEIAEMFNILWKIYPRKEGKEQAKKTFEHKLRGLKVEQAKDKANKIFLLIKGKRKMWEENETEIRFIPMFSSLLNSDVPDSPHFGGRKNI